MNINANFEHRASSSRGKHEGESSFALCDRLGRTRDNSQRQLPTDHDYAVPTREYQTDQSSLKTAPAAARSVLEKTQRQLQKHPHRFRRVDMVTPYQGNALIEPSNKASCFREMRFSLLIWPSCRKDDFAGSSYQFVDKASHRQRAGVIKVAAG